MNQLQIAFVSRTAKPQVAVPDKRYRIMVTLVRSDRPRYWNFNCMHCGSKICELVNCEVYDLTDFYDPQSPTNSGLMRHCKGILDGMPCPYSYFFNMT